MKSYILLLSLLVLASCGGKNSSGSHSSSISPLEAFHQRPLDITDHKQISFVRKKKMTTQYDCNGLVSSRGYVTQNSLSKKIEVKYPGTRQAWRSDIYNRTTKKNLILSGANYKFTVDHSPTAFNLKVDTGTNLIEYAFYDCLQFGLNDKGEKICLSEETEKEGIIQVDVEYRVDLVPGEDFIYPPKESCNKTR
jgi:hypothetical protein